VSDTVTGLAWHEHGSPTRPSRRSPSRWPSWTAAGPNRPL